MPTMSKQIEHLVALFHEKRNWLVLTHNDPDPDAIGAAFGMAVLLRHFRQKGQQVTIGYGGVLGRAENQAMVRALRLRMKRVERDDVAAYDGIVLVDCQPGVGNNLTDEALLPDVVIDHHPRVRLTSAVPLHDVRPSYGATSTIVAEYLQQAGVAWEHRVATALFYGIKTDTLGLARGATQADAEMYLHLHQYVEQRIVAQIERAPLPRRYFQVLADALHSATIYGDIIIVDVHIVHRPDIISELADMFLRLEGINWSIVIGQFDETLAISVRTSSPELRAGQLVRRAVGTRGSAGGHSVMAAGRIPLEGRDPVAERARLHRRFLELLGAERRRGRALLQREI